VLHKTISAVIPAKNESGSITKVVYECSQSELVKEVIVVDNQSQDDTVYLAEAAGARVLHCSTPGFGATLKMGFSNAESNWIFKIDADILNARREWINKFWNKACNGFDLVSGQWDHDPSYWALSYYLIRPNVDLLLPALSHIPLLNSGIYLVNMENISLEQFPNGWGFDTRLHIEVVLNGQPLDICQIEPVLDCIRPITQYYQTAADTVKIFEDIRLDPRLSKF
jgi:glycosyltransferase involved in cell wall biosynthesis